MNVIDFNDAYDDVVRACDQLRAALQPPLPLDDAFRERVGVAANQLRAALVRLDGRTADVVRTLFPPEVR